MGKRDNELLITLRVGKNHGFDAGNRERSFCLCTSKSVHRQVYPGCSGTRQNPPAGPGGLRFV